MDVAGVLKRIDSGQSIEKGITINFFKLLKPVWKLTDDEYVERARAALKWIRPWNKVASILWLLIVAAMLVVTVMAVGVALDHPAEPDVSSMTVAYVLGGLAGWIMGFTLLKAVFLNVETWTTERAYRLLIASWDRVQELEQQGIKSPPVDSRSLSADNDRPGAQV